MSEKRCSTCRYAEEIHPNAGTLDVDRSVLRCALDAGRYKNRPADHECVDNLWKPRQAPGTHTWDFSNGL